MKKLFILMLLLLSTNVFASSSTISTADTVLLGSDPTIAHWKMNDNEGTGTVVDSHVNGYDLTLSSGFTSAINTVGHINGALDFDTVRANRTSDNTFSFANAAGNDDSAFSGCAWFDAVASGIQQPLMAKQDDPNATEYVFRFHDDETCHLWLTDESAGAYIYAYSSVLTVGGNTTHCCFTYDGSEVNTGITIYVDGSENTATRANAGGSYVGMEQTGTAFTVGGDINNATRFDSWIDDVRIFNDELTAGEILNIYNSGVGHEDPFSTATITAVATSTTVTTSNNLGSLADLYIEGKLEVDDVMYGDGGIVVGSNSTGTNAGTDICMDTNSQLCECNKCL